MSAQYQVEAVVIYERHDTFHEERGPHQFVKIGVAFGSEVFWTGSSCFPGTHLSAHGEQVGFATELARRWNAGREALAGAQP